MPHQSSGVFEHVSVSWRSAVHRWGVPLCRWAENAGHLGPGGCTAALGARPEAPRSEQTGAACALTSSSARPTNACCSLREDRQAAPGLRCAGSAEERPAGAVGLRCRLQHSAGLGAAVSPRGKADVDGRRRRVRTVAGWRAAHGVAAGASALAAHWSHPRVRGVPSGAGPLSVGTKAHVGHCAR